MVENQEVRRYLTDDRDDEPERRHELVIFPGGNGDWYLGVWPEGVRGSPNTVRICTSGGASTAAPALPICVARMYRALGHDGPSRRAQSELSAIRAHITDVDGCPHGLILPLGTGFGRCTSCGDDTFPMTGEAADQCPSCGSFGEHLKECDGVVQMPWALAKQALANLRSAYSGPVPSTVDPAVEALRRIAGEVVDIHVPGTTVSITFDGERATKARWKNTGERADVVLEQLGLQFAEAPRPLDDNLDEATVLEAAVQVMKE